MIINSLNRRTVQKANSMPIVPLIRKALKQKLIKGIRKENISLPTTDYKELLDRYVQCKLSIHKLSRIADKSGDWDLYGHIDAIRTQASALKEELQQIEE